MYYDTDDKAYKSGVDFFVAELRDKYGIEPAVVAEYHGYPETARSQEEARPLIQKFVRDYMNDSAISLDMLKPEMVNELKREAAAKGVTVAVVVTNILAEWGIARLKERSKRG